jgi:hypothetical protein
MKGTTAMRKLSAVIVAVVGVLALTSCNPPAPGTVVDKQIRSNGAHHKLYLLKTRESEGAVAAWGGVSVRAYNRCYIGSSYPRCADVER